MRVQMIVTKTIPLPPAGSVTYPAGAFVDVDDELATEWLTINPPVAVDPDAPAPDAPSAA